MLCWMAKFDISPGIGGENTEEHVEANYEPVVTRGIWTDSTSMASGKVGRLPPRWGVRSQGLVVAISACFLAVTNTIATAEPLPTATIPDPPPRSAPAIPPVPGPSWDLDGLYLWVGPVGAAGWVDARWDSTFGADATVIAIRERAALGALGATLGGSRWTVRDGGRVWFDGLVGTRLFGHMVGGSAGPLVELSDLAHPRLGGSIGAWVFCGVTPYAKLGAVDGLGAFVELGLHIALPALRGH
jgi:hypothetical protein